jgi:hypothetical protein
MQFSPISCYFVSLSLSLSLLGQNILNTLFSNTFSLCSSFNVRDQFPQQFVVIIMFD